MNKETMYLKESNKGCMGGFEGRWKLCNYVLISKMKENICIHICIISIMRKIEIHFY